MTDRTGRDGRSRVVNVNWNFRYPGGFRAPGKSYSGPRTVRPAGEHALPETMFIWNYTRRAWA